MGRVQTGVFDNLIRRLYSIKGGGSELAETLGDVFPMLDLENLPSELLVLRGWNLFSGFATIIGVPAQATGIQLFNVADSQSLVVLTKIIINSQKAQQMTYGVNVALATPVTSTQNMDTRIPQSVNAIARLAGDADVQTSGTAGSIDVVAGVDREFEVPNGIVVLAPGGVFSVFSSTSDSDLRVTFIGRQRLAEPSELSF